MFDRLNFNHLRCFWAVAREGGVTRAGQVLDLTQPTISKQIGELEDTIGEPLFTRVGRRLQLTETGRVVFAYADDIFALSQDLLDAVRTRSELRRSLKLVVGLSDAVPALLARLVLEPGLAAPGGVRLVCRMDRTERLMADLSIGALDVVVADAPLQTRARVRSYNHPLGACAIGVFGPQQLVEAHRAGFPESLDGAPVLMPSDATAMRNDLEHWLSTHRIRPDVVMEIEGAALMKVFAQARHGLFFAPMVLKAQLRREHDLRLLGELGDVKAQFYAISLERKIRNPAVAEIVATARERVFI